MLKRFACAILAVLFVISPAQAGAKDSAGAQALMLANPSVIKRPVVDWGKAITVGFNASDWEARV